MTLPVGFVEHSAVAFAFSAEKVHATYTAVARMPEFAEFGLSANCLVVDSTDSVDSVVDASVVVAVVLVVAVAAVTVDFQEKVGRHGGFLAGHC